jgi:hypothetical protein
MSEETIRPRKVVQTRSMYKHFFIYFSSVLPILAFTVQASQACPLVRSENFNDLQKAEIVIRGRMLSDPTLTVLKPHHTPYYPSTILVLQTLAGEPKLDGKNIEFVFYISSNRALKGIYKNTEVIVGLRKATARDRFATGMELGRGLSARWFSVAGPCDSMGVILPTDENLERVMLGTKGQYPRP